MRERFLPAATILSASTSAAAISDRLPREEAVADGQVGACSLSGEACRHAPGEPGGYFLTTRVVLRALTRPRTGTPVFRDLAPDGRGDTGCSKG